MTVPTTSDDPRPPRTRNQVSAVLDVEQTSDVLVFTTRPEDGNFWLAVAIDVRVAIGFEFGPR
jgi:hypothetical protein